MDAVHSASAHGDVDDVVVATNSVFANSANDWVREWNRSHRRPKVQLWDRENLAVMVRRAPQVAARVLPAALGPDDRLRLLIERFHDFGETPSEEDLAFFWAHPAVVTGYERQAEAVALMLHADVSTNWKIRPWSSLLSADAESAAEVLVYCFHGLVWQALRERVRSVSVERVVEVAAHMLVSVIDRVDPLQAAAIANNPFRFLADADELAQREDDGHTWRDQVVLAVLRRAQLEMATICGQDCARVSTEASAFEPEMNSERYFERFAGAAEVDQSWLTITRTEVPCVVGLTLSESGECLVTRDLDASYGPTANYFADLRDIVQFRRSNPSSQYLRGLEAAGLR
jgi:hypothetical protein